MEETTFHDLFEAYNAVGSTVHPDVDWDVVFRQPLVLDNEGDLWIDVGGGDDGSDDDGNPANHKRVYRFRVLISGPWRERKPAAEGEKWVVALPDDHPHAMAVVFAVMHCREELIPRYTEDLWQAEISSRILTTAEKYDVPHLFFATASIWVGRSWPLPNYTSDDGEDDHAGTLQRLNILRQLSALGMLEYSVRKLISEISEQKLNALLAVAEAGPRIGVPLSLRNLLRTVVKSRHAAIQSALDFLRQVLEDLNSGSESEGGYHPNRARFDVKGLIEKLIGSRSGGAALDRGSCNVTMATDISRRVDESSVVIPKKATDVRSSASDLLHAIGDALGVHSPPGSMPVPGPAECIQAIHKKFEAFEAEWRHRWTQGEEVQDHDRCPTRYSALNLELVGRWDDEGYTILKMSECADLAIRDLRLDAEHLRWHNDPRTACKCLMFERSTSIPSARWHSEPTATECPARKNQQG
ncbi:uncharacterized protein B0H64DRAFT_377534 [Chaetomium fimeti]|uniref:Uncharacterized protein n=1 Tax=Chaetomium fimeti TaxID=1854472 RepID=A0AAE0H930_9PEZI|nr:hypothetical protein B0H64DRAFT_377534 [Chaetomium fimeti]